MFLYNDQLFKDNKSDNDEIFEPESVFAHPVGQKPDFFGKKYAGRSRKE